ncbi:unnamed protein product [Amoebophrya sp. A120]|nr:unnamed protein product [Amoebophrya sp. A120]|eukprot:GSA120T00017217001.1
MRIPRERQIPRTQLATGGLYVARLSTFANGYRAYKDGLRRYDDIPQPVLKKSRQLSTNVEFLQDQERGTSDGGPARGSTTSRNTTASSSSGRDTVMSFVSRPSTTDSVKKTNRRNLSTSTSCATRSSSRLFEPVLRKSKREDHEDLEQGVVSHNDDQENDDPFGFEATEVLPPPPRETIWYDEHYQPHLIDENTTPIRCYNCGKPNVRHELLSSGPQTRQKCTHCNRWFDIEKAKAL